MKDVQKLVSKTAFWFASIIISFIMSLLAGFSKDWTEKSGVIVKSGV
ncbi:hypothetical protein [Nitrosomonas mobilis]|nr:hypothetical protein [Nitrosomonas mobilis]